MPFTVKDLTQDNPPLITAEPGEMVTAVIHRMVDNDFSQLPVVDEEQRPIGMITNESVLRALHNLHVPLERLRVVDAMHERTAEFREDSDLFELLDTVRDTYAALIVDGERRLVGIVTNYDTTEYFRRRAEDMMLVEDVETMLKEYISLAFVGDDGEVDEDALSAEAQRISDRSKKLRDEFLSALKQYLGMSRQDGEPVVLDEESAEVAFSDHLDNGTPVSDFDDLNLSDYIQMFLANERWHRYEPAFSMEQMEIFTLLDEVRKTRNALAHFKDELTADQRDQLRFCAEWLARYQSTLSALFSVAEVPGPIEISVEERVGAKESLTIEEEIGPHESRYAPLAIWLQNRPGDQDVITLSFDQIEEIIDGELPPSAYKHRAWWANDSVSHSQSQQWLDVGWRAASANMSQHTVRFARIKERQRAYIEFYSNLISLLSEKEGFQDKRVLPDGVSWYFVKSVTIFDRTVASFNFAFGRGGTFRVELYIDTGDKELNKQLFDALYTRCDEIEDALDTELSWQRLDNRRASRIAWMFSGHITDDDAELAGLRERAVPAMVTFSQVLDEKMHDVGRNVLRAYEPTD